MMSKHRQCKHCGREIFYLHDYSWLHWYSGKPECGLEAEPRDSER